MLEMDSLKGVSFLDVGSGSCLFSLVAKKLGADVHSFDYDVNSVWCTKKLKDQHYQEAECEIEQGSVLDKVFMKNLGLYDAVYSWGVLHHTGSQWNLLENVCENVKPRGKLYIALYNWQPFASVYWTFVKKYVKFKASKPLWIFIHLIYPTLPSYLLKLFQGQKIPRGMNHWFDLLDWLGGFPFETSTPTEVFDFCKKSLRLEKLNTVGGRMVCNEYVFVKDV